MHALPVLTSESKHLGSARTCSASNLGDQGRARTVTTSTSPGLSRYSGYWYPEYRGPDFRVRLDSGSGARGVSTMVRADSASRTGRTRT
ncbi:hypothetical protein HMPREF0682_2691 [Propionibacterium acidifaciens F0233]|uniref:Uncharacterized protein n=1 Tax=Propionibacterium acidifaciens F0233 TaxID=553198 RepID=U2RM55_9ACTN|nr:hypothetical protein HMPREF0682_2691 [Propionibacterium acidifaciens F0233]